MSRASSRLRHALLLCACLLLPLLLVPALSAQGAVSYQKESEAEYASQLAGGQISSVVINKRLRTLRITLKDGRHVLAKYPPKQEPRVLAELKAKAVAVSVLSKSAAVAEEKKLPKHHKLRYIAGGILIALVVVVGGVLLYKRARVRD